MTTQEMVEMPLNGSNITDLAFLAPRRHTATRRR